jgi:hypothetical protein
MYHVPLGCQGSCQQSLCMAQAAVEGNICINALYCFELRSLGLIYQISSLLDSIFLLWHALELTIVCKLVASTCLSTQKLAMESSLQCTGHCCCCMCLSQSVDYIFSSHPGLIRCLAFLNAARCAEGIYRRSCPERTKRTPQLPVVSRSCAPDLGASAGPWPVEKHKRPPPA